MDRRGPVWVNNVGPALAHRRQVHASKLTVASSDEPSQKVESRMGAVAWGRWPTPRFSSHRVTGGGHPPPVPTERGVRISRTNALRELVHSTASACSSEYGRRSLGCSNSVRALTWLKASQVRRWPPQLRLHNIRRQ